MPNATERALADSLKKLLGKKTLNKITVKDITDDCGVNRQTFYYHFQDVYDLIEWIFDEDAKQYIGEDFGISNWEQNLESVMNNLMEQKSFVMNTYYSLTRRELDRYMYKLLSPIIQKLMEEATKGYELEGEDLAFARDIYVYSIVGIVTEWVAQGMQPQTEKQMDLICRMLEGSVEHSVSKIAGVSSK